MEIKMISVILPVHNTKKYIKQCVESVLNQTYKNIEIICIDSSTDETTNILRKYAEKYSRIRHIIDSNGSYGYKLNQGFALARGEYIAIVDSDDYIMPEMLETLLKEIEGNNLDFVKSDFESFYMDGEQEIILEYKENLWDASYYNYILDFKQNKNLLNLISVSIWTGLYRKSFIIDNKIKLHESPAASFQDTGFSVFTHILADRVKYIRKAFYKYRTDNSDSSVKSQKKYKMIADEWRWIENELKERNVDEEMMIEIHLKKYSSYFWNYHRLNETAKLLFSYYVFEEVYDEYINHQVIRYCPDFLKHQIKTYLISKTIYNAMHKDIEKLDNLLSQKDLIVASAGILGTRVIEYDAITGKQGIFAICDRQVKSVIIDGNTREVNDLSEIDLTDRTILIANKKCAKEIAKRAISLGADKKKIVIIEEFLKYRKVYSVEVSVIVPVYNAENYIEFCIKSLLQQSENSMEIILVDDGSRDNSLEICRQFERTYSNVHVIHQENAGVTEARYIGILASEGKYISFVDADDWVEAEYVKSMLNEARLYEVDAVLGNLYLNFEQNNEQVKEKNRLRIGLYAGEKLQNELYTNMMWYQSRTDFVFGILQYLPAKLYRKQVIENTLEALDRSIYDAEDVVCTFSLLLDAKRVYVSDTCYYHYRIHAASETKQKRNLKYLKNAELVYQVLKQKFGNNPVLCRQLQHFMARYINNGTMEIWGYKYVPDTVYKGWRRPNGLSLTNKRVCIYGVGKLGKACYKDIIDIPGIEIVAWFDSNAFGIKYGGMNIRPSNDITQYTFDYLIIAIANVEDYNEIRKYCMARGVDDEKIIAPNDLKFHLEVEADSAFRGGKKKGEE